MVIQKISLYLRSSQHGKRVYTRADMKKQASSGVYGLRYEVEGNRRWDQLIH